jgi:ribosome biogenesis GTPase A
MGYWDIVNRVIDDADILLLLLDARLIDETRNKEIEQKVERQKKPLIFVITKCDLVNKKTVESYKKQIKNSVFVSARKHYGTTMLRDKILIEKRRSYKDLKSVKVGVLGYPNVGKSSLINTMKGKKSAPTSILSGHTKAVQKIKADNRITFLDTPGVIPYKERDAEKHIAIGTIDFTKAREPDLAAMTMMTKYPGIIEKYYGVKINDDKEETLIDIAKIRNILIKGGKPDIKRVARMILKDWQKGEIKLS